MKHHRDIQPRNRKVYGEVMAMTETHNTYHAEVLPGMQIRIFGTYRNHVNGPQEFDKTFQIGDECEYDSFNLSYTGAIVKIGPNSVTVEDMYGKNKRLDLHTFSRRNWKFDLQAITKRNSEWMD